jgi:transcriptional regulator with XRE-family HTH domain
LAEKVRNAMIGRRLQEERKRRRMSIRALSREAGTSPSLISQIENHKVNPSVGTLYQLSEALEVPIEDFFRERDGSQAPDRVTERPPSISPPEVSRESVAEAVVTPEKRAAIELANGVRWEMLRPLSEAAAEDLEIMDVVYAPHSASGTKPVSHHGREYGLVVEGKLDVEVDGERVTLRSGDCVAFDSPRPHRLINPNDDPVRAIWFVVGRGSSMPGS